MICSSVNRHFLIGLPWEGGNDIWLSSRGAGHSDAADLRAVVPHNSSLTDEKSPRSASATDHPVLHRDRSSGMVRKAKGTAVGEAKSGDDGLSRIWSRHRATRSR